MRILIRRYAYLPRGTYGDIQIVDSGAESPKWLSVERPWMNNLPFESCIPEGIYQSVPHDGSDGKGLFVLVNPELGVYNYEHEIPAGTRGRYKCLFADRANHPDEVLGCVGIGKAHAWFKTKRVKYPYLCVSSSATAKTELDEIILGQDSLEVEIVRWDANWL